MNHEFNHCKYRGIQTCDMEIKKTFSKKYHYLFCIVPFVFYFLTLSKTLGMGDTAILIDKMVRMALYSHANCHNLTNLIGHFFMWLPFENLAFKANLFSAFWGAMAVCLFYLMACDITKSPIPAIAASLCMMVSHSLWWHSTISECYSPNAFISLLIIYCYFEYEKKQEINWIYRACFLSGFGLFNHVQMGFWLFSTLAFVILNWDAFRKNGKRIVSGLGFLVAGLLPYLAIVMLDYHRSGASFFKVMHMASGGDFKNIMFKLDPIRDILDLFRLIFMQWPGFYLAVIVAGICFIVWERSSLRANAAILIGFVINTYFFFQYHTWDKFAFLLPSFVILGFWGIFGIRRLYEKLAGHGVGYAVFSAIFLFSILFPGYFYSRIPKWNKEKGFWKSSYVAELSGNTYNSVEYMANPCKSQWDDVRIFADLLFSKLPRDAVLIDDDGRSYYQLAGYYKKYYNARPDVYVVLFNSWGRSAQSWGEGIDNSNIVAFIQGVVRKKPLFIVSLKYPYANVVNYLSRHGFRFEKFELGKNRWIYQVRENEETESSKKVE